MNENPLQGSFIIDQLTDLVEEPVLTEFDRINERGGVLGAMETGYQRGRIQDESMLYEHRKHDGTLPIIGVNTFRQKDPGYATPVTDELARATTEEKESQLARVSAFQDEHEVEAAQAIARLPRWPLGVSAANLDSSIRRMRALGSQCCGRRRSRSSGPSCTGRP